ncbi:MAG: dockerin type I domain-containing protein, partial [Oscillospiraceae bacterium]
MKKNKWFKMGAGLTAALMVCSSIGMIAFADEAVKSDVVVEETAGKVVDSTPAVDSTVVVDDKKTDDAVIPATPLVDAEVVPSTEAEPAKDTVLVPLTPAVPEVVTPEVPDVEVAVPDVPVAGAGVTITGIKTTTVTEKTHYNVTVNFTIDNVTDATQMTIFAYDVTDIGGGTAGDQDTIFGVNTPVGFIDQKDAKPVNGTLSFKVAKTQEPAAPATPGIASFKEGSKILLKIGGTGITKPAAILHTFGADEVAPDVKYGDVNDDTLIDSDDATLILREAAGTGDSKFTEKQIKAADVNVDTLIDSDDVTLILR